MKFSINELKLVIAEILDEAKKKKAKADDIKKKGASVEAYGIYDEAFDFAAPLGAWNLYARQGAANFGPYTAEPPHYDSTFHDPNRGAGIRESDERALRALVREVIQNGLVPVNSAWAPLMESSREVVSESPWHEAEALFEAWYDKFKKSSKKSSEGGKKARGFDRSKGYGEVKKHGFPPKKDKKS